jgi:hypothetical protein
LIFVAQLEAGKVMGEEIAKHAGQKKVRAVEKWINTCQRIEAVRFLKKNNNNYHLPPHPYI